MIRHLAAEGGAVLHDLEAGDWRFEIRAMGLTDRGLSGGEIDLLLANNITAARAACRRLYGDGFDAASEGRRHALVSMAFNLGQTRLAGFKRLRAAVLATGDCRTRAAAEAACAGLDTSGRRGLWIQASQVTGTTEALDSRWASRTGRRAAEVAALLRTR